jgi:hypothetical protein
MVAGNFFRATATLAILGFALLFALAALGINDILLRVMNVPRMTPYFADLRSIPSLDQLLQFENLRIDNPVDPWGRSFDYPKIWIYILEPFRVCQDPYFCLGGLQFLIFVGVVICLIWSVQSPFSVLPVVLLAVSPPVTLLLERGNNDGLVFMLVLMTVRWRGPFRTPFFIALAGGLKVFPLAALPFVFKLKNPVPYLLALVITSPLLVSAFVDLRAMHLAKQASARLSYGIPSFARLLGAYMPQFPGYEFTYPTLIVLSATIFTVAVLLAYFLFRKAYHRLADQVGQSKNDTYVLVIFGTIFLFTMLVSSNWAYRIVFASPVAWLAFNWLFERRKMAVSDRLLRVMLNTALFGAFWVFLAPYGHILFNVVTFGAAAAIYPLVTIVAIHRFFAPPVMG